MKKYRHLRAKIIVSTQWDVDESPGTRGQIKHWFLFPGIGPKRLKTLYESAAPHISFERFLTRYRDATEEQHSYFHVDTDCGRMTSSSGKQYLTMEEVAKDEAESEPQA